MARAARVLSRAGRIAVGVGLAWGMMPMAGAQRPAPRTHSRSGFVSAPSGASPILSFTPGIGSTIAGTGVAGYSGDGGPATSAQFNFPMGMAADSAGNIYVADILNDVVRKLSAGGTVSTVAGNGTQGYSGDGGPATSAQLAFPSAVAVDAAGNLYIADYFNACVRKVDTSGVISTFANAGGFVVKGVVADPSGNVYFSSSTEGVWKADSSGTVIKVAGNGVPGFGGDGGPATNAQTAGVAGLALDSQGNLYFAEVANSDVRRVATNGVITTVAGNQQFGFSGDGGPAASAKLNGPTDVRVDAGGNLYIVDSSNNRIRKVNGAGTITTIAGDGNFGYSGDGNLASVMQFAGLTSMILDGAGNLFVADTGNSVLRRVKVDTTALEFGTVTVGQTGGPISVLVSNAGSADLQFSAIAASSGFAVQSICSTTSPLPPGADCALNISFVPATSGSITGTVSLNDDAPGHPHIIGLHGQGNIAVNPDFTVSMSALSLNVGKQSSGSLTTTVTPSGGFTGTLALSCGGLPAHSTCSFQPGSLVADGSNSALTAVVSISTGVATVAADQRNGLILRAGITGAFGTGLLGLVFFPLARRDRSVRSKRVQAIQLLVVIAILCGGLVGCGSLGGKNSTITPPGNYTVTVTATSAGVSRGATFTLIVQ